MAAPAASDAAVRNSVMAAVKAAPPAASRSDLVLTASGTNTAPLTASAGAQLMTTTGTKKP
jgi:hypothetical protein